MDREEIIKEIGALEIYMEMQDSDGFDDSTFNPISCFMSDDVLELIANWHIAELKKARREAIQKTSDHLYSEIMMRYVSANITEEGEEENDVSVISKSEAKYVFSVETKKIIDQNKVDEV